LKHSNSYCEGNTEENLEKNKLPFNLPKRKFVDRLAALQITVNIEYSQKHVSPNCLTQSIIKLLNFTCISKLGIYFPMYISKLGKSFYHLMNFKKVIEPTFWAKNQFLVNDKLEC